MIALDRVALWLSLGTRAGRIGVIHATEPADAIEAPLHLANATGASLVAHPPIEGALERFIPASHRGVRTAVDVHISDAGFHRITIGLLPLRRGGH